MVANSRKPCEGSFLGLIARKTLPSCMVLGIQMSQPALADDPPTFTSVVRWDFNDTPTDGVLDNIGNGRYGTTSGTVVHSTDTPKGTGYSLEFNGSSFVYSQTGAGDFYDSAVDVKSHVDYSTPYYVADSDSRSISLWAKVAATDLNEDKTLFYHGAGPGGYFTCGVNTNQPSACRGFAVMLRPEDDNGTTRARVMVGSPDGGAFVLNQSSKLSTCSTSVDLGDDAWHHIVAIYSADLTNLGASYNTIIYIDGDKCGHGLIPQPFTDVGGPANDTGNSQQNTSLWYISARQQSNGNRYGSGGIANDGRLDGKIDEIRVYEHVLTGTAVTWLKNNTGD